MTEFEIIDDKLVRECKHEWSRWITCFASSPDKYCLGFQLKGENTTYEKRRCTKCWESQILVPRDRPSWLIDVLKEKQEL
jgi:hypothetical protein